MTTYSELNEANVVSKMMIGYGGSFVRHLGEALGHADSDNAARIKKAFPEYWGRYLDMWEGKANDWSMR